MEEERRRWEIASCSADDDNDDNDDVDDDDVSASEHSVDS